MNNYLPHVFVLPEDDANRQIANGFLLDPGLKAHRIRVLEEAGGWNEVIERFCSIYAREMERFPERLMVLIIDCDGKSTRIAEAKTRIPQHLADRVFIVGALSEPEELRKALGRYESIGRALAEDCREGTNTVWSDAQLRHNADEVARLRARVTPIIFPSPS